MSLIRIMTNGTNRHDNNKMQQQHGKQTLTEKMTQSKTTHHTITTLFQYCKCRTRQKNYLTNISWE